MTKTIRFILCAIILASCARSVSRVSPDKQIDLSGRWNDSDSRMVAQKMVSDLLGSDKFKDYSKSLSKKPAIIVGLIKK